MKFLIEIEVMPRKELLDPQGKAVTNGLHNIGFTSIENVRVGKCITYETTAISEQEAIQQAEDAAKKVLANLVMESFSISVKAL
ncbi:MAG: phosphoribosylformylglycinamidine synthase subunit PurS [Bacteroidetes bacterium]|nr:phosphoribosylformylglycinamidine synthase subunit PurS [Bacteroidota bacterium]